MKFTEFSNPAKKYRPMVRWWWPGLEVEEEELRREVRDLDEAGFGGAELQPFAIGSPAKMDPERAKRHHRFMQPYHFKMIAAVLDEAQKHGLFIDITENSSWPTGGTHISLEDSYQTLLFETSVIKGGSFQDITVKPLKKPKIYKFIPLLKMIIPIFDLMRFIPEDKKLVKVIAGKLKFKKGKIKYFKSKSPALLDPTNMIDLTDRVDNNNKIRWEVPKGKWQLFFCYAGSAGSQPLVDTRSEPGKNALVVSHFSRQAITNHIEAFLGKGKEYFGEHYGSTFRAFFTDSLELISPMNWSKNFLEEFRKRRGYDLSSYLPVTYIPLRDVGYWSYMSEVGLPCFDFEGDLGTRIRYDYERTISDLFVDEFIKVLQEWGEKNGLQSRVQGYGVRVDNLEMLGYSGIPETEQLYGGGMLHFLKLAGAAGTLYNRNIVTSESMVWMYRAYMTTPLKWRVAADRLFESGINQMIYHGFPYRHPDYPFPGFQPFSVPDAPFLSFAGDFSRDSVFWQHFPLINGYIARIQYLMQETKTISRVGIFYGLFDFPNGDYKVEELTKGVLDETDAQVLTGILRDANTSRGKPKGERLYVREMAELGDILVANGYYYLNFNRDRLLKATMTDGKVIMGEGEFETLVFFKETHLPFEIMAKLEEIASHNIPIIFIEHLPTRQSGFKDWELNDQKIKTTCESISNQYNSLLLKSEQIIDYLTSVNIDPQLRFPTPYPAIGFIQKNSRVSNEQVIMLRNRSNKFSTTEFSLPQTELLPFRLDAFTGESFRLPFDTLPGGEILIRVHLEAYQSIVIGLASKEITSHYSHEPMPILSNQGVIIKEISNWNLNLSQRNVDGTTQPVQVSFITPEDWRTHKILRKCSGPAKYSTEFNLNSNEVDPKHKYILVFDRVCDIATVTVNDTKFDPILLPPWQVNITSAIQGGSNSINVIVETTYRNLLVGYANSGSKLYKQYKKRPLMPTGLIGKVSLWKI
jgi:hypothetical protein